MGLWLASGGTAAASPGCSLSSVSGVSFGPYDPGASEPLTTTGSITLCCEEPGLPSFLALDLSPGSSGTASSRTMTDEAKTLSYNLFLNSGHTLIWGDGFDGTSHYGPVPPATGCTSIPIYGLMSAGQPAASGSYSDSLTVTLTF